MITPEDIKITKGGIAIESISVLCETDDCLLISIDCRAKYAECTYSVSGNGEITLILYADGHTLYAESDAHTEITIAGMNWRAVLIRNGRYNVAVAFIRESEPRLLVIP